MAMYVRYNRAISASDVELDLSIRDEGSEKHCRHC